MKKCTRCITQKPMSDFRKSTRGPLCSWCRQCERDYQKGIYKKNPELAKVRATNWREKYAAKVSELRKQNREKYYATEIAKKYGMTKKQAAEMIESQGAECKACGVRFDKAKPLLRRNLDHCHTTGRVRGFLCSRCNTVAGLVQDDAIILGKIAIYLNQCITT